MSRRWPSKLCSPEMSLCMEATYLSIFGACCYLTLDGWRRTSAMCFFCVAIVYQVKAVVFCVASHMEVRTSAMPFVFFAGRVSVLVFSILTFIAAMQGYSYLTLADPATSLHGVGLGDLAERLAAQPRVYDVILTDGFVQSNWTGIEQQTHCDKDVCYAVSVVAAPMYASADTAHGPPLAWAVGRKEIRPVYCGASTGLCGIYEGGLERSGGAKLFGISLEGVNMVHLAAEKAADRGGFPLVEGLPTLRLGDPVALMKASGEWMRHLWSWFLVSVVLAVFANGDTIGVLVEKGEGAELRPIL